MRKIKITAGKLEVAGWLNETNTASRVWEILPIGSHANLWGEEIYFPIPLEAGPENPKELVALGDIGYWPPGQAMCLFFGKTPLSRGDEIRPYSPVNIIGKIGEDSKQLQQVKEGEIITVTRAE